MFRSPQFLLLAVLCQLRESIILPGQVACLSFSSLKKNQTRKECTHSEKRRDLIHQILPNEMFTFSAKTSNKINRIYC